MALIIEHGQLKYFSKCLQDSSIRCRYSSECTVEYLINLPSMKQAVTAASVIVVHCGIYNLPRDSVENLLQKFQYLYSDLKELNPEATVIFSSILPITTNESKSTESAKALDKINRAARQVNTTLGEVAGLDRYPDIVFLSHDQDFQPNYIVQRHMLSRDGVNLSFPGIQTLVRRIETEIKRILSKPNYTKTLSLKATSEKAPRKSHSPAVNHICVSPSSANSEESPEKADVPNVNHAYSVQPKTSTQPQIGKDRCKERKHLNHNVFR